LRFGLLSAAGETPVRNTRCLLSRTISSSTCPWPCTPTDRWRKPLTLLFEHRWRSSPPAPITPRSGFPTMSSPYRWRSPRPFANAKPPNSFVDDPGSHAVAPADAISEFPVRLRRQADRYTVVHVVLPDRTGEPGTRTERGSHAP